MKNLSETEHRLIVAGFGGQGILTAGKLLATACLANGKHVTFLPSYGSEVRGGTANCHIVISGEEIGSPAVEEADSMIILNEPSLLRFGKRIRSDGSLFLNNSLIETPLPDLNTNYVYPLPATEQAVKLGNAIVTNMIMLGAFIRIQAICDMTTMERTIRRWLEDKGKSGDIDLNLSALNRGAEIGARILNPRHRAERGA